MAFAAVLLFEACSALLDMGAKMPPGGHEKARPIAGRVDGICR